MIKISHSEIDSYRQCRFKHQLQYREGWRSEDTAPALQRGTHFHTMLELHYRHRGEAALEYLSTVEDNDQRELLAWIYSGYCSKWGEDLGWEVIDVERWIEVPLADDVVLRGKIDLIARDEKGRVWIWDHKTSQYLPKAREHDLDDQLTVYLWALREEGMDVRGAIYNACRTNRPKSKEPKLEERFDRYMVFRTDAELETVRREYTELAREAYQAGEGDRPRSPDPDKCRWRCPFVEPCLLGRRGGDSRGMMRDFGFIQKKRE